VTFDVRVDLDALGLEPRSPARASSLDTGGPLFQAVSGDVVEVTMTLSPHDIDVVLLESEASPAP
jgi:hypothetical protein